MAITSANKTTKGRKYGNTLIRYGMIYVSITFLVLLFLNLYCSRTTQEIFVQNKKTAMLEKVRSASLELSEYDVLNQENITQILSRTDSFSTTHVLITDPSGRIIYDSKELTDTSERFGLFPEIYHALCGNDTFSWNYSDGIMISRAAAPIFSYSKLTGCIYLMENDTAQGSLLASLQRNILTITLVLEGIVILFSVITALIFTGKLRTILSSMRIIRGGDYTHKMKLRGRDEMNLLADEFNGLTERLQTSENKRRQFVSDASHELKTPLASIKLLSDSILQNEMDPETVKEFVTDIGNEADRLNRMSQKLLSLSKIESQEDAECEIILTAPTVDRVIRMLSGIAAETNVTILKHIETDCPILIMEDDLYQIIFNLVENGIKYNRKDGTLTIHVKKQDDNAIITVSDSGVGIPEDAIVHIFERFYRVDKARSRKSGGSGLGLSIVKNLVERNGGTIDVQSTPGSGTQFILSFPIFDTEELL